MHPDDGHVRLWLRALLDRYDEHRLLDYHEYDRLSELGVAETYVQDLFADVGLVIAQLMQVEHGMNAVLDAHIDREAGTRLPRRHRMFGNARTQLVTLVDTKTSGGLLAGQLDILDRANTLRNHLAHGEVNVAVHPSGTPWAGEVAEVFWFDGDRSDVLDVPASRELANEALNAVVDIMMALDLP